MEVIGIHSGFQGLLDNDMEAFDAEHLSGLLGMGGTVLGTSRVKLFPRRGSDNHTEKAMRAIQTMEQQRLDCLVCIGGSGTQATAARIAEMGVNVVTIPQTIDNDVWGTDSSIGFDSAVEVATEAIDRLHSTASSHKRVMLVEVMGHRAGWIALFAGMAGGADVILLPELGFDIQKINEAILRRAQKGKPHSIVVVAEGLKMPDKKKATDFLTHEIEAATGIETRKTVLGYIQRGGNPSPYDRVLATRLGGYATELIVKGMFGRMVCVKDNRIDSIPLSEVAGKLKLVTPDHDLVIQGKRMGISFGV